MKHSNLTAPRSLSECAFYSWADPIERPQTRQVSGRAVWFGLVALLCVVGVMLALGVSA